MKKNKFRKRMLLLSTIGIVSAFSICTGVGYLNVSTSSNKENKITNKDTNLNALDTSTSSTSQSEATFSVSTTPSPLNKTADKVLNSDIEKILTPSSAITNFSVVILPVTQKNINEGYVNFLVFETYQDSANSYKTVLAKANGNKSDDIIDTAVLQKYTNSSLTSSTGGSSSITASDANVFSTKKISQLTTENNPWITPEKYTLSWASDESLKNYITNSTSTDLTSEDVWNNFFGNNNYLPPLKSTTAADSSSSSDQYTTINVEKVDAKGNKSETNTGMYKVEVKVFNTTSTNWTTAPANISDSTYTITKYFGGFLKADGVNRDTISINVKDAIGNWTITNLSTFIYGSIETNKTVNTLAASEFVNPIGGTSSLISMFDSGVGLKQTSSSTDNTPIINYSFNSQTYNFYNSSNTSSTESASSFGIEGQIISNKQNIKITNIQTIPDDTTGSLKLIFTYDGYSIYSDSIVSQTYTYTYPNGTFSTSSSSNQNSILTWKNVNVLSDDGLSTSYDIVNEFNKNKNDSNFVRLFTNQFLDTTSDVLSMDREAIITYGTDTNSVTAPEYNQSTGDYQSASSSASIVVQLTFKNWSKQEQNKVFTTTFTFPNYKYIYTQPSGTDSSTSFDDSLTISWKSSSEVLSENPSYSATLPSDIVYNLLNSNSSSTNDTTYTKFFTGSSLNSSQLVISYLPNDNDGSILVFVSKTSDSNAFKPNSHIYSQLFVGFKSIASSSGVVSYSWLPQDEVSIELLSIPLSRVTKDDVMKYYLDNISLFQNGTLSDDNVEIIPDISSSSLTVKVTINDYNKDDITLTSSSRTFVTKITGFTTSTHTNDTVFSPPKNLTAVISVSAATLISITLGVVLCGMLIRRARIRDFRGYHNNVLTGKEKKKNKKKIIK